MLELFNALTAMLEAAVIPALAAAFAWGVLSILLSPCHLAGIPLIMGHIALQSDGTRKKAGLMAFFFALGILVTLLVIGVITSLIGRMIGYTGPWVTRLVGLFLLFFGIYLAGILPFDLFNFSVQPSIKKRGLFPSFLLGLIFGLALGPCTFAFMAPMMALAFQVARTRPAFSFGLFALFALGHCAVIVLAGLLTEFVRRVLRWNEKTGAMDVVKRVFGILIALSGVYLILSDVL